MNGNCLIRCFCNLVTCASRVLVDCVFLVPPAVAASADAQPIVEVEEIVAAPSPANNGAGPTWCYGSTIVARQGDDVYASIIETGRDVPPLCNTRWQLWHRSPDGWKLVQSEREYRQREPCPIAVFHDGPVFVSANPSTQPPGTQYGPCQPIVLEFDPRHFDSPPKIHEPTFAKGHHFTDHSYRGFAADGVKGELLLLNIDAPSGAYFVAFRDRRNTWHPKRNIRFPIRSCYPQVQLRNGAAHVLAIGDIVEPVEEWRNLKFKKLKRKWDYVFRRLFYTYTPDIRTAEFRRPIEIDTVEKTAGHITNLDLYVDPAGAAHLLYLKRPHQHEFMRDRYFPGEPMTVHLEYAIVKDGRVRSRRTLAEGAPDLQGLRPAYGRFHVAAEEELCVIVAGTMTNADGKSTFGNYVACIVPDSAKPTFVTISLEDPFGMFFTNTPRGGSRPSDIIDLFGIADDSPNLRYARIRLVSK